MDSDLYLGIVASFAAHGAPTPEAAWEIAREVVTTPHDLEADSTAAWLLALERHAT